MNRLANGHKHNSRCENSKSKKCKCQCRGEFHGLTTGVRAVIAGGRQSTLILKGAKTYMGHSNQDIGGQEVTVTDGMHTVALPMRLDLMNHSPTGFAWGYGGSGPAQLALALLADVLQNDNDALRLYGQFKFEHIATLDQNKDWTMTDEQIRQWSQVKLLEAAVQK